MFTLLVMLLNGHPPPTPWHLVVGQPRGSYLVWRRHGYADEEQCIEALTTVQPPALAYCERDPPQV